MEFSFYSAGQIIFGKGSFGKIGALASGLGKHALIVIGGSSLRKASVTDELENILKKEGIAFTYYEGVSREPDISLVETGAIRGREAGCDMVIGIGGGSVLDTAKAAAGLIPNPGSLADYLGVKEPAKPPLIHALPWIAVPTTAGTGSEVTNNAVINVPDLGLKKSFRSPLLIARIALVDPELSLSLPPNVTAYSGMDALTQLIESYVTRFHQPFSDALALEGIKHVGPYLFRAYRNGNDREAREHMILASLLSGLALSNSRLGAVHGISASVGGRYSIPHGLACAAALPYVMEVNLEGSLERYAAIGEAITGVRHDSYRKAAETGLEFIKGLSADLGIPETLREFNIPKEDVPLLVSGSRGNSMNGNPVDLSDDQIAGLISRMI